MVYWFLYSWLGVVLGIAEVRFRLQDPARLGRKRKVARRAQKDHIRERPRVWDPPGTTTVLMAVATGITAALLKVPAIFHCLLAWARSLAASA